ncbi:hypothetical protein Q8F57_039570 [Paraburkholderia terrae]|uniref:hypothetical protein n=1 Tax=Paraburkholderia terrae TaxID=311230 RepID=UPI00296B1F94|nr:hypothetical protein [Paraburkholderia terrae]MDW3658685.1 hypothetical protein [Paraburkholderia terrae]
MRTQKENIFSAPTFSYSDFNAEISSSGLSISNGCVIKLRQSGIEGGESEEIEIDCNEYHLPPNDIYFSRVSLSSRRDLVAALIFGLDAFLTRTRPSHSKLERVSQLAADLIMFFEALWIRNVCSVEAMRPSDFDEIAKSLAKDGWPGALMLLARAHGADVTIRDLSKKVTQRVISERLATNYVLVNKYLRAAYRTEKLERVRHARSSPATRGKPKKLSPRYSVSQLRSWFVTANLLFDARVPFGMTAQPFPKPYALAKSLGRPAGRTENLTVESAGRIFRTAMIWLYEIAPLILALIDEMAGAGEAASGKTMAEISAHIHDCFIKSESRKKLNRALKYQIKHLDANQDQRVSGTSYTLRGTIRNVLASCFILIAFMNARRKCEVSHKTVGLMTGCMVAVSEPLGIYQVMFYIAKTFRKRIPFYVNQTTVDAVKVLEELQRLYGRFDSLRVAGISSQSSARNVSLFSYRRFSSGYGQGVRMVRFDFTDYDRQAGALSIVQEAFGKDGRWSKSHVFRRMYAIVFYYRYENGDIIALMLQFGSIDLDSIRAYISDPLSRHDMESIYSSTATEVEERRRARMKQISDIDRELRIVGDEKLAEEIYAVLAGKQPFAGGFATFVRKVYMRLAQTTTFSSPDAADAVVQAMKRRGHFPQPFPHGQCMLGVVVNQRAAHCFSETTQKVERERANVRTCTGCRYHHTKEEYLTYLKADRERKRRELPARKRGDLERQRLEKELLELDQAIELLQKRLGIENA